MRSLLRVFPIWTMAAGLALAASAGLFAVARPRADALFSPQNSGDTPASHQAAGIAAREAGRLDEAVSEFQAALRLDRNYVPSMVQLADILSSNGRIFEAYGLLQHAVEVAPDSADVHAILGRCFFQLGKLKQAREELQRALALNPNLNEPFYALAAVQARQGRLAEARKNVEIFLQRAPGVKSAEELHATICFEMKDYDAALAADTELLKADPSRTDIPIDMGRALLAAGRYFEAEQAFQKAVAANPQDRESLRGWFDASYKRGAYQSAVESMEKLGQLEPASCQPRLDEARAYRMLSQFAKAREQAEKCLAIDSAHAGAHLLLGWIAFSEGNLSNSKLELEKSLASDPSSPKTLYWLGMVDLRQGSFQQALARLENARAADPDDAQVRYQLALIFNRLHRPAEAQKQKEEFRRLQARQEWNENSLEGPGAKMSPAAPSGQVDTAHLQDWLGFSNYLLQENQPRQALSILEKARQAAPDNPEGQLLAAAAYTDLGDVDAALGAYAEAEKREPMATLFLGRGTLYQKLGESDLALADLRRAVKGELPAQKAALAHTQIASLLNDKKQYREAKTELRRAVSLDPYNTAARTLLGWTEFQLSEFREAASDSRAVLQEDSTNVTARLILARALLAQKNLPQAVAEIEKAAASEGETARVLFARGLFAAAEGRTDSAIDYFNRSGQADPTQAEVFYFMGKEFLIVNQVSNAAIAFEKATIVDPGHAASWLSLGKIYLGAKRAQQAVGYLQKAIAADPVSGEAHYELAVALNQTGNLTEARKEAQRAKELGQAAAGSLLQSLAGQTSP